MHKDQSRWLAALALVALVAAAVTLALLAKQAFGTVTQTVAPGKIIYTYWEGEPSPCATACINSMRHYNPGWEVRVLGRERWNKAGDVTQRADRARIEAMAATGGVWLDASCLCVAPIEAWVGDDPDTVYGFVMVGNEGDCMENWAFAARRPHNAFLTAWRDEFANAQEQGIGPYCSEPDVPAICSRFANVHGILPYLTMHLSWLRVRRALPDAPIVLHPPTPFHYQIETDWDEHRFAQQMNTAGSLAPFDGPFIKLRGGERRIMDDVWRDTAPEDVAPGSVLEHLVRMGQA